MSTAKEQAIQDIKNELKLQGKSFLAFRRNLNPIMDKLVTEQLNLQAKCLSSFTKKL